MKKFLAIVLILIIAFSSYFLYGLATFFPEKTVFFQDERGRIGNQLFQYSAAYALAKKTKSELVIISKGKYLLEDFTIPKAKIIHLNKLNRLYIRIIRDKNNRFYLFLKNLFKIKPILGVTERNFFEVSSKETNQILEIQEYFESPLYFGSYRQELLKEFQFKFIKKEVFKEVLQQIGAKDSYCVHVRRGDMVGNKGREASINFQKKAIELVKILNNKAKFFVFSDNPDIAEKELEAISNVTFMEENGPIDDLFLMSACANNIITKSSFSWWAAYLNQNNPMVIAPYNAYNEAFYKGIESTQERYSKRVIYANAYPENWILLNDEYQNLNEILPEYIKDKSFIDSVLAGYEPKKFDLYLGDGTELKLQQNGRINSLSTLDYSKESPAVVSSYNQSEETKDLEDLMKSPYRLVIFVNGEENALKLRAMRKNSPMVLIGKTYKEDVNIIDYISHVMELKPYKTNFLAWYQGDFLLSKEDKEFKNLFYSEKITLEILKEFENLDLINKSYSQNNLFNGFITGDIKTWKIFNYLFLQTQAAINSNDQNKIIGTMIIRYPKIFHLLYKNVYKR